MLKFIEIITTDLSIWSKFINFELKYNKTSHYKTFAINKNILHSSIEGVKYIYLELLNTSEL